MSHRMLISLVLSKVDWWPADATRLLNELGDTQDQRFSKPWRYNLHANRKSIAREAGRNTSGRQADKRDKECWRNPVNIILKFLSVDLGWEVQLYREWLHWRRGCEQDIEPFEQYTETMKDLLPPIFRRCKVGGR